MLKSVVEVQIYNTKLSEIGMNDKLQFIFNLNSWIRVRKISEMLVAKVNAFCKEREAIKAKVAGITNLGKLKRLKSKLESEIHKNTIACSQVVKLFKTC